MPCWLGATLTLITLPVHYAGVTVLHHNEADVSRAGQHSSDACDVEQYLKCHMSCWTAPWRLHVMLNST